jgi:hypothetical protein
MVGEAQLAGIIGQEEAASLTDVPNYAKTDDAAQVCEIYNHYVLSTVGRIKHPAEGDSPGELADPGAGQRTFGRPRPLDPQGQTRLRDPGAFGRLRPPAERAGRTSISGPTTPTKASPDFNPKQPHDQVTLQRKLKRILQG